MKRPPPEAFPPPRITKAHIKERDVSHLVGSVPDRMLDAMKEPLAVVATFGDGSVERLFEFYSDELTFTGAELVGLTRDEALDLHRTRDIAWIRS